jgi:hypothetical protein
VRQANEVTEEFLHRFKAGDLVDVKEVSRKQGVWTRPHKLLVYKIDPPTKEAKPAALGDRTRREETRTLAHRGRTAIHS